MIREVRDKNGDLIDLVGAADWTERWVLLIIASLLLALTCISLDGLISLNRRLDKIEQSKGASR